MDWTGLHSQCFGDPGCGSGSSETTVSAGETTCCEKAEKWLKDNGTREGTFGLTFCCGGVIKHCDFDGFPDEKNPAKKEGYALLRKCAQKHEKEHAANCDCEHNKMNLGKFAECKPKKNADPKKVCAKADKETRDCLDGSNPAIDSANAKCNKKFGAGSREADECSKAAHSYDYSHGKNGEKCDK
jgi:hypothetical protein